jgi:hypothetical protein
LLTGFAGYSRDCSSRRAVLRPLERRHVLAFAVLLERVDMPVTGAPPTPAHRQTSANRTSNGSPAGQLAAATAITGG